MGGWRGLQGGLPCLTWGGDTLPACTPSPPPPIHSAPILCDTQEKKEGRRRKEELLCLPFQPTTYLQNLQPFFDFLLLTTEGKGRKGRKRTVQAEKVDWADLLPLPWEETLQDSLSCILQRLTLPLCLVSHHTGGRKRQTFLGMPVYNLLLCHADDVTTGCGDGGRMERSCLSPAYACSLTDSWNTFPTHHSPPMKTGGCALEPGLPTR